MAAVKTTLKAQYSNRYLAQSYRGSRVTQQHGYRFQLDLRGTTHTKFQKPLKQAVER